MAIIKPNESLKDKLALLMDEYAGVELSFKHLVAEESEKSEALNTLKNDLLNLQYQYSYKGMHSAEERITDEMLADMRELVIQKQAEIESAEKILTDIKARKEQRQTALLLLMPDIGKLQKKIAESEK